LLVCAAERREKEASLSLISKEPTNEAERREREREDTLANYGGAGAMRD
jgi:hypothetical protein